MKPTGILETALYVDDLERAENFYQKVLGLTLISKRHGRHAFFTCGSSILLLFNPDSTKESDGTVPTHGATGEGHIAFSIEPNMFDAWRTHLQKHGVTIEKEIKWPKKGYSIYFRDPSGNSIELTTPEIWQ